MVKSRIAPWQWSTYNPWVLLMILPTTVWKSASQQRYKMSGPYFLTCTKGQVGEKGCQQTWKIHQFLIGKPSISMPFSMAMLNNQRVLLEMVIWWFGWGVIHHDGICFSSLVHSSHQKEELQGWVFQQAVSDCWRDDPLLLGAWMYSICQLIIRELYSENMGCT